MPESVKISSSTECGSRPSSTCAWGTPPRTARRHASILGIMPAPRPGRSRSRPAAVSTLITSAGRGAAPLPDGPAGGAAGDPAGGAGDAAGGAGDAAGGGEDPAGGGEDPAGSGGDPAGSGGDPAGAGGALAPGPAGQSRYRPSTSVSTTSLAAPSATARAAAAVSALTL